MPDERAYVNLRDADLAPQAVLVLLMIVAVAFKMTASAEISADVDPADRQHSASPADAQ